jgi:hypothetical protein
MYLVLHIRMERMSVSALCNRSGKLFCFNSILNFENCVQFNLFKTCIYPYHSLQLDFAVTMSALLGIPFPYGRCSVRILSTLLLSTLLLYLPIYIINCNCNVFLKKRHIRGKSIETKMQVMGLNTYICMNSKVDNVTTAIFFKYPFDFKKYTGICTCTVYSSSTLTKLYLLPLSSEYCFC